MKKIIVSMLIALTVILYACNDGGNNNAASNADSSNVAPNKDNPSYDPNRGEGKFTKVDISPSLDVARAEAGGKIYGVKCGACHKLTDEKLVGPGWKGVTDRHTAEWIMNFVTNTDEMITKDPKAQAMLEICLVRMPNQNISDEDARNVYEFMRKNDGLK